MKHNSVITFLLSLIAIFTASAEKFESKVGEFTNLQLDDKINVVYSNNPDSVGYARFEAPAEMADKVLFSSNNKGRLRIQVATEAVGDKRLPVVYVYSSFLKIAENTSDSVLRIATIAPTAEFQIVNSGNGKIVVNGVEANKVKAEILTGKGLIIVSGKCTEASLKVIGTGEIQADKLLTQTAGCTLLGTGCIGCNASDKISIKGSGTGKVYYVGNPAEIKTHALGSIKAIRMDGND